jgi:hypothetical protein
MRKAPCGHPAPEAGCHFCELATKKDVRYAMLWWGLKLDGPVPTPTPRAVVEGPAGRRLSAMELYSCLDRRGETGKTVLCEECGGGKTRLKTFTCLQYGECTIDRNAGIANCSTCATRKSEETVT